MAWMCAGLKEQAKPLFETTGKCNSKKAARRNIEENIV